PIASPCESRWPFPRSQIRPWLNSTRSNPRPPSRPHLSRSPRNIRRLCSRRPVIPVARLLDPEVPRYTDQVQCSHHLLEPEASAAAAVPVAVAEVLVAKLLPKRSVNMIWALWTKSPKRSTVHLTRNPRSRPSHPRPSLNPDPWS